MSIFEANQYFKYGNYEEAKKIYITMLSKGFPDSLTSSIKLNIDLCDKRMYPYKEKFGFVSVSNINDAIADIEICDKAIKTKPGLSALLRAKNAERFIEIAISSVADLVDEIIVVDNNSQDGTFELLKNLELQFNNLFVYQYNIDIPKVGSDHESAVKLGSLNTLGTYYNWCLSKVTTSNVLKWDADFVCIRRNLGDLIDRYNLRSEDYELAVWCTGLTSYYGKVFNLTSYYDEFRIFSKKYGAKWSNWKGCETLTPAVNKSPRQYIYPSLENVKNKSSDEKNILKNTSKPVFIEIKDYLNLKPINMLIDNRDRIDNILISRYNILEPNLQLPKKINTYKALILIPNLKMGGGNYWAKFIYDQLLDLGIEATIGAVIVTHGENKDAKFHGIPCSDIFNLGIDKSVSRLNKFSHIILTTPIPISLQEINGKVFCFTHSDISYFNKYIVSQHTKAIALNQATIKKLNYQGIECSLLRNYLPYCVRNNSDYQNATNFNLLYCNRISEDKNVLMLLYAFKLITEIDETMHLTLLAGGCEDNPIEFGIINAFLKYYALTRNVTLLKSQSNVQKYYMASDCVILPSVSEGCSYGLLEAINYEVPIISTKIDANLEVTRGKLPHFIFEGLQQCIDDITSVNDGELYSDLLGVVGYVQTNVVFDLSVDGKLNYELFSNYFEQLQLPFDENHKKIRNMCPTLFNDIVKNRIYSNNKLLEYINNQQKLFDKNAKEIVDKILYVKNSLNLCKNIVTETKETIRNEYFSKHHHKEQLLNILFSDDFLFVVEDGLDV